MKIRNAYVFLFDADYGVEELYIETVFSDRGINAIYEILNRMNQIEREDAYNAKTEPNLLSLEDLYERISNIEVIDLDYGVVKSRSSSPQEFIEKERQVILGEVILLTNGSLRNIVVDIEDIQNLLEDQVLEKKLYDYRTNQFYAFTGFYLIPRR